MCIFRCSAIIREFRVKCFILGEDVTVLNFKKILIAFVVIVIGVTLTYTFSPTDGEREEKGLVLTVIDEQTSSVLLDHQVFKTNASSLGEFLRENHEALQLEAEESKYGLYITGILGLSAKDNGPSGPFWLYQYESKEQGIVMPLGQAPSADQLPLFDKDEVTFHYSSLLGGENEG